MTVPVRVGRRMTAAYARGEGRKPKYENKTKQQARAEVIAHRAGRKKDNGKTNNV